MHLTGFLIKANCIFYNFEMRYVEFKEIIGSLCFKICGHNLVQVNFHKNLYIVIALHVI